LFQEFIARTQLIILSDFTLQELEFARDEIRSKLNEIPEENRNVLGVKDEAIKLAETYISEEALTNKSYNDALLIALATINNSDVLASWNFKYIVNLDCIRLYNSINFRLRYKMIEIRTPREIIKSNDNG